MLHFSFCILLVSACSTPAPVRQDPSPASAGVRPGDVVKVEVWREPDYSNQYPVDERGRVQLPQLGALYVTGHTREWVRDTIISGYRRILANPTITVSVLTRVTVSGEVGKPGFVFGDATMTVADLIAGAGGPTPLANRGRIELLRGGRVIVSGLGPGTMLQRTPIQSGDEVYVPQRGWMARNGHYFISGLVSVASAVTVALIVRR